MNGQTHQGQLRTEGPSGRRRARRSLMASWALAAALAVTGNGIVHADGLDDSPGFSRASAGGDVPGRSDHQALVTTSELDCYEVVLPRPASLGELRSRVPERYTWCTWTSTACVWSVACIGLEVAD